jgi:LmbE family N-acetylglucosaminyl deacetylase
MRKVLILSPHVDDGVIGCGGTIAKLAASEDVSIRYLVFSPRSHEYGSEVLCLELRRAVRMLGLSGKCIEYLDFETRVFPENRQELTDVLFEIKEEGGVDAIFTPTGFDVHQDHQTVTNELLRVYKRLPTSIFGYEIVLNTYSFNTAVFSGLEERYLEAKLGAIDCFESQMSRSYFSRRLFESCARVRGAQMGAEFAEAFEAIRVII